MNLGKKIKFLRTSKNLTQKELAKSLFVSYQLVSKWERNVSSPTAETLLDIVDVYHLPLDFFINDTDIEPRMSEKEKIFVGFTECMLQSENDCPTVKSIASITNMTENTIKKYFHNINELIYAYIVHIDKNIKLEVEQKVVINKNILTIFIEDMAPLLYHHRLELKFLYTRPYVKNVWINFIRGKYKNILSNHTGCNDHSGIELEYAIEILTSFISTWLSQPNPENLEDFQMRIKKLTSTNINQWPIFNQSL
ncbi:helix-turn-helix domain-containing protein [Leuconostoc falkenbergense]|uniref:helix-turn-helix domain-containing protein n=1 Tax=Leuconostoc falkenbergense TaxID=2766470 RepID=UPI0024A853AD|nr:helix-turn-helix transcriptional regulator [Leuconostoc falkenbergense]MDI6553302.1 helix-turn-helix transcriptional regulator [Leuconostoc falkenbergense]